MQYRTVPKNGDQLSVLGYGCMRLPVKMQSINVPLAKKQIYSAIDQGVNYIDTAVPYHNGKSEPFLGKILSQNGYRDKVKLATKLPHWSTPSKAKMDNMLAKQLKKLQTDHIDYYLVHALNGEAWEKAQANGVIEFLDQSLKDGRIVNAGFSFHGAAEDFKTIVDSYDWTVCQIQYNYLDTQNQAGTAGLQYAAAKNMAVIVMEPLRGGNLARVSPPAVTKIWNRAATKRTPAEWALRWVWNQPEVTLVLSGMNRDAHIAENLRIAEQVTPNALAQEELALVDEAAEAFRAAMKVGCTGCQYCMPCPAGVNIPGCFEFYNSRHTFKDRQARLLYTAMTGAITTDKSSMASECVACGTCEEKCPQNLPIPDLLKDVADDMEGFMTKPLMWIIKRYMRVSQKQQA